MNRSTTLFADTLLNWYKKHGRKQLPWQQPRGDYRVWLSEIMLQQTQVKTVIPYFMRFIERFPDIETLANAKEDEVFSYWSGLGYYARARNLHKTAKIIHQQFQNQFPSDLEQLKSLPGIGDSTAAAIASLVYNQPTAILDGNVKRVLARYFLISGSLNQQAVKKTLWELANACMPTTQCADYTQAIMDMGATCCTIKHPNCTACPLQSSCLAYLHQEVANYPQQAIKKALPIRHEQFLLCHTVNNTIYLEKRPPTGIWGGLWSLPFTGVATDPCHHIQDKYAMQAQKVAPIMALKHTFTHFKLHITAVSLQIEYAENQRAESLGRWFSEDELRMIGLAKPVQKIIERFLLNVSLMALS